MTRKFPEQTWRAGAYAENARFVSDLARPVVELLAPRPGERILDLGCGDGALTAEIAAAGADVIGIDSAPDMVTAACGQGIDARLGDAERIDFDGEFDAVFSNATLHWVDDPGRVTGGVARALRPGGRFVGEFGGHGNVAAITAALMAVLERRGVTGAVTNPWYNPTAEEFGALLRRHGFLVESSELIPRPTPLPSGMAVWIDLFAARFLGRLPEKERTAARDEAVALLAPVLRDTAGGWTADYVRLRFAARLPGKKS